MSFSVSGFLIALSRAILEKEVLRELVHAKSSFDKMIGREPENEESHAVF